MYVYNLGENRSVRATPVCECYETKLSHQGDRGDSLSSPKQISRLYNFYNIEETLISRGFVSFFLLGHRGILSALFKRIWGKISAYLRNFLACCFERFHLFFDL